MNTEDSESIDDLIKRIGWDEFCEQLEKGSPPIQNFLQTWGGYCGAPRSVFRGHLCKMIVDHWKNSSENRTV